MKQLLQVVSMKSVSCNDAVLIGSQFWSSCLYIIERLREKSVVECGYL